MNDIREQLVSAGFSGDLVDFFINSLSWSRESGQISGPMILRESLVINRSTGAYGFSSKPYNLIINIPKLLTSASGVAWGFHNSGDSVSAFLSMAAMIYGSSINITKHEAAIALALHDLQAYLSKDRFISEDHLIESANRICKDWSVTPLDKTRFGDSVNNLLQLRALAIVSDRYALVESVIVTRGRPG